MAVSHYFYPGRAHVETLTDMERPVAVSAKVRIWFLEMRAPFFTAVMVPTLLGTAIAWHEQEVFDLLLFVLTLLGVTFIHAGTNIVNDYFDYRGGTDIINRNKSPFNGGSPFLVEGVLTPRQVYRAAIAFFAAGSLIGLYLAAVVSPVILILGAVGVGFGYFYTSPRVNLAARGVGEVALGTGFGPLIVSGAYLVQTGAFSAEVFLAGIPVGILIGLVLFINQFPDMEADKATGKTHWVARMGLRRAASWYSALMVLAFLLVPVLIAAGIFPLWTVLALVMAPVAVKAMSTVLRDHEDVRALVPSQAMTIQLHLLVGLLLSAGFLIPDLLG